jgi:hypothetical protein
VTQSVRQAHPAFQSSPLNRIASEVRGNAFCGRITPESYSFRDFAHTFVVNEALYPHLFKVGTLDANNTVTAPVDETPRVISGTAGVSMTRWP